MCALLHSKKRVAHRVGLSLCVVSLASLRQSLSPVSEKRLSRNALQNALARTQFSARKWFR